MLLDSNYIYPQCAISVFNKCYNKKISKLAVRGIKTKVPTTF